MLGPAQEKDDFRINTDPPVQMNLGGRQIGRLCPPARWSLGRSPGRGWGG